MKTIIISGICKIRYILFAISIITSPSYSYGQVDSAKDTINKAKALYIGLSNPVKIQVPGVKQELIPNYS